MQIPLGVKKVLILFLERKRLHHAAPDLVPDHQLRQLLSVYQDDPLAEHVGSLLGGGGEGRGGYEQPLCRLESVEASEEVADGSGADGIAVGIPLCLDIDAVQPQRVLVDDAVDAAVACLADECLVEVGRGPTVAHGDQQVDDHFLEEGGRARSYPLEQGIGERVLHLAVGC